MKKVLLTLAVAFGMIASANAQLVIGGGIEFGGSLNAQKTNGGYGAQYKQTDFNFGFTPKVGYIINDKIEVGGVLMLGYNETLQYTQIQDISDPANPGEFKNVKDWKRGRFEWAIRPYARYRCLEYKGFGLWIEGWAGLGTSTEGRRHLYAYGSDTEVDAGGNWRSSDAADLGNKTPDGHKYSKFNGEFYVHPVLTYTVNEHWIIESTLSFLSLGISGYVEKETNRGTDAAGNDADITDTNNEFNWGLGVMQGRVISLGVAYKF